MENAIKATDYNKERRQRELAEYSRMARAAEETRQMNEQLPQFNSYRNKTLEEMVQADIAAGKISSKEVQFEQEEKEEKETEEIYYIK